jgi:lipopolysaccharide export system protein LptA
MNRRLYSIPAALVVALFAPSAISQTVILGNNEPLRLDALKPGTGDGRLAPPVAPGEKPSKRAKGPTEITAREAHFDNRTNEAVFTNEVLVKDPEFNISCDRLTAILKKGDPKPAAKAAGPATPGTPEAPDADDKKQEKDANGKLDRAIAEGNVVITQDKVDADGKTTHYLAKGRKAVYDATTGNVTLTGWPSVMQSLGSSTGKQIISREESCVIVMNRVGKIDVKGYHTTTLTNDER